MNTTNKAILIARVSTREQAEGYSLDSQEKLLEDYASNRQLFILQKFIVPESARGHQERKQFNEMLEFLHNNPNIKIVLCEKVDRISRNFKDALKLDEWLNGDEERQIHFVKQNLILHKNAKSHEKFQWDIYLVLARQYSNNLSEETRKGLTEKASQNCYPGHHKSGYQTIGDTGHKLWSLDTSETSEAPYIKRAFELYDTGEFTTVTLGKHLFKEGWKSKAGRPIAKSTMHKYLRDCFYCGEFKWNGKHYPNGDHQPLISKELFYRVQARIEKKIVGKAKRNNFLLAGLIKCGECSRSVCGEIHKHHHYYRCTRFQTKCSQRSSSREELLEEQIITHLGKLQIKNVRLAEWLKNALKESHADEVVYHNSALQDLNGRYTKTQQKLDMIYDEKLEEKITPEFYEKKFTQYSLEADEIISSIQRHKNANISYIELGSSILDLTQRAQELYEEKASPEKKRKLLSVIFAELKLKDKILTPTYNKAFQFLVDRVNTLNQEEFTLEPKKSTNKAVVLKTGPNSKEWRAIEESNLGQRIWRPQLCHLTNRPTEPS